MKIIADIGSCHMAKLEYCKEAIDLASNTGCWAIKFQLFKGEEFTKNGNIELPREWWGELVEYAKDRIIIFASCFDVEAIDLIRKTGPYIKIPYSKRFEWGWLNQKDVFVSCSPSEAHKFTGFKRLFCIPEYPVLYKVDFNILRQYKFIGFSDHTVGYEQTLEAVKHGAKYIEKHITLDHSDINCPDHYFSLRPKELKEMMYAIQTSRTK